MRRAARPVPGILAITLALSACGAVGLPSVAGSPSSEAPSFGLSPSSSPSPLASSGAASPAAGPSAVPSPATGWERSAVGSELAAPLTRVVWTGTHFLAVDMADGTLLDSTDGRVWRQQPRVADGSMSGLVAGSSGALATGSRNAQGVVAMWHSSDGLAWSPTPDAASLHGRDGAFLTMAAIVPAGGGWLAVGGESLECDPGACRLVRAVAWTSPDGLQWTRSADTAAMQHAEMTGVVRTPTGYVAVGDAAADPSRPGSPIQPAVWTSPDGHAWTRSGGLPVVKAGKDADVILDSVAVAGGRVVAVGHVKSPSVANAEAFAWRSDGDRWSSAGIGPFTLSQDVRVVAVPGGLIAMFGFGSDASCQSAIWRSADGASWSCVGNDPVFAGSAVSDAAAAPGVEVLVGSGPDGADVWTSVPH